MAATETEVTQPQVPTTSQKLRSERAILEERARTYTDYSAERKAEVLALIQAHDGNVLQVANLTGIAHQTIRRWLDQADRYSALRNEKSIDLAKKLEDNAHRLADSIADHDLSIVPLQSKATALGIMVEKMQLLRGEPTSITANVDRQELSVTLNVALAELGEADQQPAIDVTPEAPGHNDASSALNALTDSADTA